MRLQHSANNLQLAPAFTEIEMSRQPFEDRIDQRLDTHWSRFVYCDEPVDGGLHLRHRANAYTSDTEPENADTMNDYTSDPVKLLTELDDVTAIGARSPRGPLAYRDTPARIFHRGSAGNDDNCGDETDPRDLIVAPELRRRLAAANGDIARTDVPVSDWLSGYELYLAARTRRSAALRALVLAAARSARAFARNLVARYRRRREMHAIYDTLQELDDRALRDLGFHRSEIMSVAAEAVDDAERTRVRTLRMPRAPRW
jgi:uncharacterized protein YjiS (DUF1127 family)